MSRTEMHRKMAEIGGIAYETETSTKLEGSGPMAGDLFAVPAGYALKERK